MRGPTGPHRHAAACWWESFLASRARLDCPGPRPRADGAVFAHRLSRASFSLTPLRTPHRAPPAAHAAWADSAGSTRSGGHFARGVHRHTRGAYGDTPPEYGAYPRLTWSASEQRLWIHGQRRYREARGLRLSRARSQTGYPRAAQLDGDHTSGRVCACYGARGQRTRRQAGRADKGKHTMLHRRAQRDDCWAGIQRWRLPREPPGPGLLASQGPARSLLPTQLQHGTGGPRMAAQGSP